MIVIERTVDISKPIQTETLRGNEFKLEANAHTFRISVVNNGAVVPLTGSVSASMLLADGSGLTLGGSLDNGVAVLTLPQAAYGVPGRFMLAIYSVQTGATEAETVKTCIYACVGAVINTYGDQQYDPGNLIPDAETLAAYIEACQTATTAANTAAGRAETAALTAVTYAEQTGKTDAEKAQARTNIGAASEADIETAMAEHFPATGKLQAGVGTSAAANGAVATGVGTTASGRASHAEGQSTTADGQVAHAEGYGTFASGDYSHAEGFGTVASGDHQHAFGKYNVEDANDTYLEIAGNGTGENARSNARTLDWNGNETLAGDLTVNKGGAGEMALGQEVSSLKSAMDIIDAADWTLPASDIIQGSYSISSTAPGKWVDKSARIRNAGFIHVIPGYKVHFVPGTNAQEMLIGQFHDGSHVREYWYTTETTVTIPADANQLIIVFRRTSSADIAPADYDATVTIKTTIAQKLDALESEIDTEIGGITGEVDALKSDIAFIENSNDIMFSLTGSSTNYALYKHNFSSGDKINIRCAGYRCNLIGEKASDDSIVVLINNLQPSEQYTTYTFSETVKSIGLYLYDTTKTSTIYITSDEQLRLYNDAINRTDTKTAQKADGVWAWDENTETTAVSGKIVYGTVGNAIGEYTYATGNYAKCAVSGSPKIRVKGYGWDSSSNFALWFFTDADDKVLQKDTVNGHTASSWYEVDVPSGAVYAYANGNNAITAAIQIQTITTDFAECYELVKNTPYKLITLGDSITKLGTGERGWVGYFLAKTNGTLVANVAVDGAQLVDKAGTVYDGNPTDSDMTNNVLGNQVQKIINNNYDAPDLIMIAVGTNNGIFITEEQIKAAYYDNNNTLVPLADADRTTGAGAYRYCTETLHNLYPNAVIVWCAPIYSAQASRRMDQIEAWGESLEIATRYSGQMWVDTFRCGINGVGETVGSSGEYLYDGLHPNAKGAQKIGLYNASKVMPFLGNLIKSGL